VSFFFSSATAVAMRSPSSGDVRSTVVVTVAVFCVVAAFVALLAHARRVRSFSRFLYAVRLV